LRQPQALQSIPQNNKLDVYGDKLQFFTSDSSLLGRFPALDVGLVSQ